MKIVIIEDEYPAQKKLKAFLKEYDPNIDILACIDSVAQGLKTLPEVSPDLIFSDIELLDGNVFHLFEKVKVSCPIIFTTSYDEFLLDAFQTNGIGYLLKPFSYVQVQKAIQKYHFLKGEKQDLSKLQIKEIHEVLYRKKYKKRFTVRHKGNILLIELKDIKYIKIEEGVLFVYHKKGQRYALNETTIGAIENKINNKQFFKINRGELVNIDYIEKIAPYTKDRLAIYIENQKELLYTSTNKTPEFRKWIDQ